MKDEEMRLSAREVEIGMFVTRLDKPWLETPFMLQGFAINSKEDLALLIEHCNYCYVDIHHSKPFKPTQLQGLEEEQKASNFRITSSKSAKRRRKIYKDSTEMTDELKDIRKSHTTMSGVIKDMVTSLKFTKKLDLVEAKAAIKPMVESIIRNPDALLWLSRLRQLDDYNYSHSLGCSIWAMAMGRQLGMNRIDIEALGLGGLLLDIGKTRVPDKILSKRGLLTEKEIKVIKKHVQHSLDIISTEKGINFKIKNMVESHHERIDGSGYPHGIIGSQIPLFGKIAAIIDCYDAITSDRCYAEPLSSQEAVKKLYEWRDTEFQAELVEEFIQAIGMFPAGSLVELTTGEVAVVVTESRTRRLRPKIMLLLAANKEPREDYIICNLMHETHNSDGQKLDIKCALPTGSFSIRADDYFL